MSLLQLFKYNYHSTMKVQLSQYYWCTIITILFKYNYHNIIQALNCFIMPNFLLWEKGLWNAGSEVDCHR